MSFTLSGFFASTCAYYLGRPHRILRMQAPIGAMWLGPTRPARVKSVVAKPVLAGLHHEYAIAA